MANQTQRYQQQQQQQYQRQQQEYWRERELDDISTGGRNRKDTPIFSPRAKVRDRKGNVKQRITGWKQNDPNAPDYDPKNPFSPEMEDVTEVRFRPSRGYAVPGFWEGRSQDWTGPSHGMAEGVADWTAIDPAQVARRANSGLPTGLTRRMKGVAERFSPGDAEEPAHPWAGQPGGPNWGQPRVPTAGLPQRQRQRQPLAIGAGPRGTMGAPASTASPRMSFPAAIDTTATSANDTRQAAWETQQNGALNFNANLATEPAGPSSSWPQANSGAVKSKSAATRTRRKTRGMADPRTKMTRQAIGDYGRSRLDEMKAGNGTQEPPSILFSGEVPEGSEEGAARPLLGTPPRRSKGLGRGPGH